MNRQNLPAHICSKMNDLGFAADFMDASGEAWKKQSATGYIVISAHDTSARPLFPNNNLHAALDAKVWAVRDCDADLAFRDEKRGLTLEEAIAMGTVFEKAKTYTIA
jgi:GT2 family glycosyltransferase